MADAQILSTQHRIAFDRMVRKSHGTAHIDVKGDIDRATWFASPIRKAVGDAKNAIDESYGVYPLPTRLNPYDDKDGRVKALAEAVRRKATDPRLHEFSTLDRMLIVLASTFKPVGHAQVSDYPGRDPHEQDLAVEGYDFYVDFSLARAKPKYLSAGEVLALEKWDFGQEGGPEVIPLARSHEPYVPFTAVLRELVGHNNVHMGYLHGFAHHDQEVRVVSVIVEPDNNIRIASPCLPDLDVPSAALTIVDERGMAAYLFLDAAEDAANALAHRKKRALVESFVQLGQETIMHPGMFESLMQCLQTGILMTLSGPVQVGAAQFIDPEVGPQILGGENWTNLKRKFDSVMGAIGSELEMLLNTIGNCLFSSREIDQTNPFFDDRVGMIMAALDEREGQRVLADIRRLAGTSGS